MRSKKLAPYLVLFILLIAALVLKRGCGSAAESQSHSSRRTSTPGRQENGTSGNRGLDRNPAHIRYSKHAECRMDCRHISKTEIREILKNGKINYRKSELQATECRKKYAVEGYSSEGQHIRIIVAPCADELTLVTCIDLDKEWECACEGD